MRLALFDLDNTLLAGDSDFEWAQFLIEKGVARPRSPRGEEHRGSTKRTRPARWTSTSFSTSSCKPLSRHPRKQLDQWHAEFMQKRILPDHHPESRATWWQAHADDARVIITATNSFVTWPIAREFGIENLIATEPEEVDGEFTGKVNGVPSFREGKVTRLRSLAGRTRARLEGDQGDLVLQRFAERPAAALHRQPPGGGRSRRDTEGTRARERLARHQPALTSGAPAALKRRSNPANFMRA